jgi:exosome complex RNA-binding protein Rrp42 (RNase PH superfamily)
VLAAVKAEVAVPGKEEGADRRGRVAVTIDLTANPTGALDRRRAEEESVTLSAQATRILVESGALPVELLCIVPGKKCWALHIDAVVLSAAGNVLDAALLAIKAALKSTLLPAVTVVRRSAAADSAVSSAASRAADDVELDISDDPADAIPLAAWDARVPMVVTVARAGGCAFVDPSADEEACVSSRVSVALNDKGKLLGTFKLGAGALAPETLMETVRLAHEVSATLQQRFRAAFARANGDAEAGDEEDQ